VKKIIAPGFEPYGIAVDEASGCLVVANRNLLPTGPGQHHASLCGGRNGFLTLVDLFTLERLADFKPELTVDPYAVATKR
jgi:hypothetical protein